MTYYHIIIIREQQYKKLKNKLYQQVKSYKAYNKIESNKKSYLYGNDLALMEELRSQDDPKASGTKAKILI